MPKEGLNVYFTASDKLSPVLGIVGNKINALDKDTQHLAQSYKALEKANEGLRKKKAELNEQLDQAERKVTEARQAFNKYKDETHRLNLDKAKQEQEKLREAIEATTKAIKENEETYEQNVDATRKKASEKIEAKSIGNLARTLATGEVGKMVASSLGEAGGALLESALGDSAASMATSGISGAISGAMAGSVIPGIGTAVGALIGGISGLISGATEIFKAKEDAFKDYYKNLYETVNANTESLITTGSKLSEREAAVMTHIQEAAGEGYDAVREKGLAAEELAYGEDSELGKAVMEITALAGENKAYMENLSEQYTREALSAVLLGEETTLYHGDNLAKLEGIQAEYAAAKEKYETTHSQEAKLDMERLYEEAQALAIGAYESSGVYEQYMEDQLEQIDAIRENTAGLEAATNAYRKSQELSKGRVATFAYGLNRVPYDNYPVLLHEGERVLTASEARAADGTATERVVIQISGNTFTGTGEEMAEQLAEVLARRLEEAARIAVPR